ncbi:hypothetical protein GYMLUDRAFT_249358 [Collybiopsis luxurians FD-317 M1]|uniref:Unplaced genomic scaffold GYMLUscaffold_66, whole genome shotgun sequence n=1 Tax=Collybiopsis luxurians FD-317 M1 TaxID=944289 RepID=A0A0D0BIM4_9AGAR|nr:hypothetical protein GYMLUDRAFT_249358 [Collybiopsis luxurians FD-317 M1]
MNILKKFQRFLYALLIIVWASISTSLRFQIVKTSPQRPLTEFQEFAADGSQWLIDIAYDLFDPRLRRGSLYILDNLNPSGAPPHPVNGSDPLHASRYEYRVSVPIQITKINGRACKSKTGPTMREQVLRRDDRIGDHQARILYSNFVGPPPLGLAIFDPVFGVTLTIN